MRKKVSLFILLSSFIGACSEFSEDTPDLIFSEKKTLGLYQDNASFDEIFDFVEKRALQFPDDLYHAFGIAANMVFADNYIISIDQMQNRIYLFNNHGEYLSAFGRKGQGPGEYSFIQFWDYSEGILYVYDGGLKKFSLVSIPDLNIVKEFSIDVRISDFSIADDKIVAITPSTPEDVGIVSLIDISKESVVHRTHRPEDLRSTIYLARSSIGDMTSVDKNFVLMLYPDKDYIYKYKVVDDILSASTVFTFDNIYNDFRPHHQSFPTNLNPYGSGEEHTNWFESSSHLFWINYLQPDLISIIGSHYIEPDISQYFLNLYTFSGDVIAEGIDLTSDSLALPATTFGEYLIFPLAENTSNNKLEYYLAKIRK